MTDLDTLFAQIGWQFARQDGNDLYYMSKESIQGFQPTVKISAGEYELEEIVAIVVYQAYLDGMLEAKKLAVRYIGSLL